MRFHKLLPALLLATVATTGCAADNPPEDTPPVSWASSDIDSYYFIIRETGFTGDGYRYAIDVEDGEVVSCFTLDSDDPIQLDSMPTIAGLMARIDDTDADTTITVSYDPEYGYPGMAEFEVGQEGWGWEISYFRADFSDTPAQ